MNVHHLLARFLVVMAAGLTTLTSHAAATEPTQHVVSVNQVGYPTSAPKRFTAPITADGAKFWVHLRSQDAPLFQGVIQNHIGDFSAFKPADSANEYVITVAGGALGASTSDPFSVRENLWREQFWPATVDFMVDIRSVTGTHPSAYGGGAFRDSTYYAFEAPSLIMLYQAAPKLIDRMPRQIDWAADKARVMSPDFPFDPKNPESEGVMDAVRRYYTELAPPVADAPDVIKLTHWALGYILVHPASRDPSRDPLPKQIHSQHVEQFAYLLNAWPQWARWLPKKFREKCHEF
ncbi:MAG: hypothetical protein ABIV50_13575, partial [Opitutus sp.]